MVLLQEVNEAIRIVALGSARRIASPGKWIVFRKDGCAKPRLIVL